jgi:CCT motif
VTRAECLERYREKKLRRLDVNTIRYMKRKINADRRPREPWPRLHCLSCLLRHRLAAAGCNAWHRASAVQTLENMLAALSRVCTRMLKRGVEVPTHIFGSIMGMRF